MKISIVITAYNVAEYLEECLNSAINQTHKDLDIFVVEDCSTDNTKDIINKFIKKDKRIILVQNKKNVGPGLSRRAGIEAAIEKSNSEYILLLDGDDYLTEDFIADLAKRAEETNADIVSGGITIQHDDGVIDTTRYGEPIVTGPDKVTRFWGERIVFMNNKIIRKSLHKQIPYCHRRYIEDTPVIIPQLHLANKVAYVNNVGYIYRMRQSSLTHQADEFKNALYRALCAQDLIEYFKDKEPEYQNVIQLGPAFTDQIQKLIATITPEGCKKYMDAYIEFTMRILDGIKFN